VAPDESRVLGCVYLYPSDEADVEVRLWVRREVWDDGLDPVLEATVRDWLAEGAVSLGRLARADTLSSRRDDPASGAA
jgi:hypothetical protein